MQTGFAFADIDGASGLPVGLVAFNGLADDLAKYGKGASLRISGMFRENNYTKQDGTEVEGFQIVIDGVIGVKASRGKFSAPKQKAIQASADFQDDPLPDRL